MYSTAPTDWAAYLGDKEVYVFPKGISPKVNVIAQLKFELTYFEAAV